MRKIVGVCPYWDTGLSHHCQIVKGGLFIPMPQHVEFYCTTSNYPQCPHYLRGQDFLYDTAKKYGFLISDGRRRYRRMSDKIGISLSACDDAGRLLYFLDKKAYTVDLSIGGIRVDVNREFQQGISVSLNFGEDFTRPGTIGKGKVRWCQTREDRNRYQAGIAFTDFQISEAVGEHMGLLKY